MTIGKLNGDVFGARVAFDYKGAGGSFDVGIGLKYTPTPTWAFATITLPPCAAHQPFYVDVQGIWYTDLPNGREVETLKFFQIAGGPRDIGGGGFIEADWDWPFHNVALTYHDVDNLLANYW